MLAVLLPLIIWFGQSRAGLVGRLFWVSYVLLLVLLSALLLSRIALLIVIASLVFYFAGKKQWRKAWPALVAMPLAGLAAYGFDSGFAAKLQSLDLTRLRVWIVAWQMFVDAPWFGHGPGSYSVLYSQYLTRSDVALQFGHEGRNMGWAHNLFLESAAEKGLFGLSVVLLYFGYLLVALRRKLKSAPSELGRALLLSVFMCLLAAGVELTMLRVWVIYIVYLLLGLVAVFTSPQTQQIAFSVSAES
jgi:O-antigen ligase